MKRALLWYKNDKIFKIEQTQAKTCKPNIRK